MYIPNAYIKMDTTEMKSPWIAYVNLGEADRFNGMHAQNLNLHKEKKTT